MDPLSCCARTWMLYPSKKRLAFRTRAPSRGLTLSGKTVPVAHSCGHDMHVACLIGATSLFAKSRDSWKGTLMAVFQPGEETAQGAKAMIDDGMFKRFSKPDVVLGQHVMSLPSGNIDWRAGVVTSSADSLQIRMFGRGAHGSMPSPASTPSSWPPRP